MWARFINHKIMSIKFISLQLPLSKTEIFGAFCKIVLGFKGAALGEANSVGRSIGKF